MPYRSLDGKIRTAFTLTPRALSRIMKFRNELRKNNPDRKYQFNLSDAAETLVHLGFSNLPNDLKAALFHQNIKKDN